MKNTKFFIILLPFIMVFSSCSSHLKSTSTDNKKGFEIIASEVQLAPRLVKLIQETKQQFLKTFNKRPLIIIIGFHEIHGQEEFTLMSIENRSWLYLDEDEKLFMHERETFIGGVEIDGVIILIDYHISNLPSDLVKISQGSTTFKLRYSNEMDSSENTYKLTNEGFNYIKTDWSYDFYTE